ncbi:hypothetical protein EJB05_49276, partial [Eragrostis curvula]
MLDGMPAQKRGKEDEGAPAETGGVDRLDALPDALLHHVLSFLPVEEAVRTSVLARRWRHLWKSAPGLRIGCLRDNEPVSVATIRWFVDHLLLLRGASPLDRCELRIGDFFGDEEDCVNFWFRYAVACKVRGPEHKIEMKGTFSSRKQSTAISEHLEIVEIKCEVVDERVFKVLKFLLQLLTRVAGRFGCQWVMSLMLRKCKAKIHCHQVPTHPDIHSSPTSIAFPSAIPSFPASAVACLHCCHHSISLEPSPLITTYTNTLI